jgi:NAD(P)-dependent dehydrogenase (short-subunit alcohol dehydrogenase family)
MMRLTKKIALITGGASGIGMACCKAMAKEGAAIAITDINDEAGQALAEELTEAGYIVRFYHHDVTSVDDWKHVILKVTEEFGGLNVVVNNAGIGFLANIENTTLEAWNQMISVNQTSVFLGTKLAVLWMKEHGGGSIINMSSIEGIVGNDMTFAYNAAKGAVRLLTKSAAIHCGKMAYDIRVNSVHPGFIRTPMVEAAFKMSQPSFEEKTTAAHPIGRIGEVEDVANGVIFLASEESSFMTGSELVIDGGFTAQ